VSASPTPRPRQSGVDHGGAEEPCVAVDLDPLGADRGAVAFGDRIPVAELLLETVRRKVGGDQQLPHGREVCLAGGADREVVCRHGFTSG
jgi:hypothetical protein